MFSFLSQRCHPINARGTPGWSQQASSAIDIRTRLTARNVAGSFRIHRFNTQKITKVRRHLNAGLKAANSFCHQFMGRGKS
jgi:hypothetical protein